MNLLVLHGPNINRFGHREPEIYGHWTLEEIDASLKHLAVELGVSIDSYQSNHEGELIDRIQESDHFLSEVGCLEDSPGCDVLFQLNYQLLDGTTGNLGSWREEYDGVSTRLDIDLSGLKGRSVQLFLEVFNYGDSQDANAFWLVPQIHLSLIHISEPTRPTT